MNGAIRAGEPLHLPPRRILAVADLTPAARSAIWRAALIARESGASLQVLHPLREPAAAPSARSALDQLGAGIHERLGIALDVEVLPGDLLKEALRAARDADLLVCASRPGNTLRERLAGAPLERLVRLSRIPALVVKRPAAPPRGARRDDHTLPGRYGRVLVSVDLGRDAAGVIAAAAHFSLDPAMEVFHAVSARRDTPGDATAGTAVERARSGVQAAIAEAGGPRQTTVMVGYGRAAPSVLTRQRAIGAELLVVGKRQRGLLADFLLGNTTQQVLAASRSDVLVVPTGAPFSAPHAVAPPQRPLGLHGEVGT